jgi:glyoxylase-like metal-dependent hydrolase (beta-lactamase superfamily II)
VIAKVHELFPGRKISCVINTHAHFDHAGGLRAFVAEGVKVVTHERNAAYYTRAWKQPRTLNPDALSASKRKPQFETFTVKYAIDDGDRPIEIHAIEGSGHNDAFAMVYLPAQKILVEADAWTPTRRAPSHPHHQSAVDQSVRQHRASQTRRAAHRAVARRCAGHCRPACALGRPD